ncbi:MAG: FtsX-like permease family protein [Chloroflexi bacterium]|nr:FtsX-like permease family protein [Chloroflexota bacterium]
MGLLAAIFAGVLIASTVLAGSWIYIRSLERVGVEGAVEGLVPASRVLRVLNSRMPFTPAAFEEGSAVLREASAGLEAIISGDGHLLRTPRLFWGPADVGVRVGVDENGASVPRALIQRMAHLVDNVDFVEGRPPSEVLNKSGPFPVVETAVRASRAAELGVQLNDVLEVGATPREFGRFIAIVTGLFEPKDSNSLVWAGIADDILSPSPATPLIPNPLPLFVRGDAIWELTRESPIAVGEARWFIYLDQGALASQLRTDLISGIDEFEDIAQKKIPRSRVGTGPRATFENLERRAVFAQTPTYLMGALLISVALYYLYMVAGLLAERRREDISMLRSRGISTLQVAAHYGMEMLPVVAIPVAAAPFLALLVISQIGRLGAYRTITGGDALPVELSWVPFAFALATGVVALLILITPAVAHARTNIVAQKKMAARPSDPPFFQRFFLDFVVLALGGLVLWELRTQQTIVVTDAAGTQSTDISALFGPVLILVAVALIFLRFFPLVLRVITWALGRHAPIWATLGLWKLSRTPYQYAWPILLLVLGSGLGVLASTLAETLELSSQQRIQYATASDFHVENFTALGGTDGSTINELRALPGVDSAALGLKAKGRLGTTGEGHEFDIFAVDPIGFAKVSWFRDDFADIALSPLLDSIYVPDRAPPVLLPNEASEIGMWARVDPPAANLFLWVVLQDANGQPVTVTLGPIQGPEWGFQSAQVPDRLARPARIASILVFEPVAGDGGSPTTFYFDDLEATIGQAGDEANREVIIPFESRSDWATLATSEGLDTVFTLEPEPPGLGRDQGEFIGQMVLGRGTDGGVRGIYRAVASDAFPVIASESFLDETGIRVGEPFVSRVFGVFTPLVIVNTVKYFPTLDPGLGGFVITDYAAMSDFLKSRGNSFPNASDELYFEADEEDISRLIAEVRARTSGVLRVVDTGTLTARALVDPLAVAGWRGMAAVALIGTFAIVGFGYITYLGSYIARSRPESAQLSVLGMSRRTYLLTVATEHVIVGVVGLSLGTVTGLIMTDVAVDAISHTESGGRLIPPFVLSTDWTGVSLIYVIIGVIGIFAAVKMFRQFRRLALNQLMRVEE